MDSSVPDSSDINGTGVPLVQDRASRNPAVTTTSSACSERLAPVSDMLSVLAVPSAVSATPAASVPGKPPPKPRAVRKATGWPPKEDMQGHK